MQLRTATTAEDWEWIYPADEALDIPIRTAGETDEAFAARAAAFTAELQAATETNDFARLPLKDGKTPARWKLRQLRGKVAKLVVEQAQMGTDQAPFEAAFLAVALALQAVDGVFDEETGEPFVIERDVDPKLRRKRVSDEHMDILCDVGQGLLVNLMGTAILRRIGAKKK
jgi:hypothetical protein